MKRALYSEINGRAVFNNIEYCKTNLVTLANHNRGRQSSERIRKRSHFM